MLHGANYTSNNRYARVSSEPWSVDGDWGWWWGGSFYLSFEQTSAQRVKGKRVVSCVAYEFKVPKCRHHRRRMESECQMLTCKKKKSVLWTLDYKQNLFHDLVLLQSFFFFLRGLGWRLRVLHSFDYSFNHALGSDTYSRTSYTW